MTSLVAIVESAKYDLEKKGIEPTLENVIEYLKEVQKADEEKRKKERAATKRCKCRDCDWFYYAEDVGAGICHLKDPDFHFTRKPRQQACKNFVPEGQSED